MLIEKLLSLFLSLPFFKSFEFSQSMIDSIKSISSYFYQLNSFLNLDLLADTILLSFGMLAVVAVVSLIRAVI